MFYNINKPQENSQSEKNLKIQEIYKDEMNNQCFDCGKPNPDFISANNGVFICRECMGIHYQFTDEVSLIIKNNLFLLNEEQINYIYYGGNRKLLEFINYKYPKLKKFGPEMLYKTQAMQYYRDNLYYLVEGGNKPIKPTENCAYNLIPNLQGYSLIDRNEENTYINNNSRNKHYKMTNGDIYENNSIFNSNEENILEEEENDIDSNLNIKSYYTTRNENNHSMNDNNHFIANLPYNKSFVYNKRKTNLINDNDDTNEDKNYNDLKKKNIRQPKKNNLLRNNSTNNNFHQKRDNFFKEMNRLFGGSGMEDDEENYEQ